MLADFPVWHPIATAAFKIIESFDRLERRTNFSCARGRLVTQPAGDRFSKRTAQHRRWLEFDTSATCKHDRIEPHHVDAAAGTGTDQPRHGFEGSNLREAPVTFGRRARYFSRIEIRAGSLAEGLRLAPGRRPWFRHWHIFGNDQATACTGQPHQGN